jgi:hypothetical protein
LNKLLNKTLLLSSTPSNNPPELAQAFVGPSEIKKINKGCYRFWKSEYTSKNEALYQSSRQFLQHLPFPEREKSGISATFCKIGSSLDETAAIEGILWTCNNAVQKSRIKRDLKTRNNYLEGVSYYRVEIQSSQRSSGQLIVEYCSAGVGLASMPTEYGTCTVKAYVSSSSTAMCGTRSVIDVLINGERFDVVSTLGGVIRVGTRVFALTTAHSFRNPPKDAAGERIDTKGKVIVKKVTIILVTKI